MKYEKTFNNNEWLVNTAAPFHGRKWDGDEIPRDEILTAAGLDWSVDLWPEKVDINNTLENTGNFALIRDVDNAILGTGLSERYKPVQNSEMVNVFDRLLSKEEIKFCAGGTFNKGANVWLLGECPDRLCPPGDAPTDLYVMVSNSHDGSASFQIIITPVRMICNNMFRLARKRSRVSFAIRHVGDINYKIEQVHNHMKEISERFKLFGELSESISRMQVNHQLSDYLDTVIPLPKEDENGEISQRALRNVRRDQSKIRELWETQDSRYGTQIGGTGLALFHATTEYATHHTGATDQDRRFERLVQGTGKTAGAQIVDRGLSWLAEAVA